MSDSRSREMNAARGDHAHDDADAVGCWVTRVPELEHTFSGRLRIDPVDAAAVLARADLGDQYIVYEWAGTWHVAAGAAAELSVTADALRLRAGQWHDSLPVTDPVEATGDAVSRLQRSCPERWCYGWAAFELAYCIYGMHGASDGLCGGRAEVGNDPIIHVMVPAVDVVLRDGRVSIASTTDALLSRVRRALDSNQEVPLVGPSISIPDMDSRPYSIAVQKSIDAINDHQLNKVVLSRVVPLPERSRLDFAQTYVVGRRANTPARSFLMHLGGWSAVGFSPETVLEVDKNRRVRTLPLAGTRALVDDPETARRIRGDLLSDVKEIHEHAISAKLAMDEVRRVCDPGTVSVDRFMDIEERGSVQHLASRVTGVLRDEESPWTALSALFPAITTTGVPKSAALDLIHSLEDTARGLYGGAVLALAPDGALDAALILRTVFQRRGRAWLRVGAGIVEQSTWTREWEETCEKLRSIAPYLRSVQPTGGTAESSSRS